MSTTIVIFSYPKLVVFRTDLHKMMIKHRIIIGEYATKRCLFDLKKMTIVTDLSEAKSIFIYFYVSMLQHVVFVYLANTAVLCYSLTIICCCQVQNYLYHITYIIGIIINSWNMKNDWEKKTTFLGLPIKQNLCHFN